MTPIENTNAGLNALVLAGGGARAAYEVGVLQALLTGMCPSTAFKPLDFGVVAGTSAGGLNASLLLASVDDGPATAAGYLEDVWLNELTQAPGKCNNSAFRLRANPLNFAHPDCYFPNPLAPFSLFARDSVFLAEDLLSRGASFLSSDEQLGQRALEFIDFSALVSTEALEAILSNRVNLAKIRSSSKVLRIACTDWQGGTVKFFDNACMTDEVGYKIILASSAIPGVFRAVEIEGRLYVDGGIVMNAPLKPAIDCGASILHVIQTDTTHVPLPKVPNTPSAVSRALHMALSTMLNQDVQLAADINLEVASGKDNTGHASASDHRQIIVHRYSSSQCQDIGWLSFAQEGIKRLIDLGFRDAVEHDCAKNGCVFPVEEVI